MTPGIIILVATVLCFLVLGLVLILRKPTLPKGSKITIESEGREIHTIFACGDSGKNRDIATTSVKAIEATITAWKLVHLEVPDFDEICVLIQSESTMQTTAKAWGFRNLYGFVSSLRSSFFQKAIPLITIAETQTDSTLSQGALVIHEMLHILNDDYVGGKDDHSNSLIWDDSATDLPNVQKTANTLYQASIKLQ